MLWIRHVRLPENALSPAEPTAISSPPSPGQASCRKRLAADGPARAGRVHPRRAGKSAVSGTWAFAAPTPLVIMGS